MPAHVTSVAALPQWGHMHSLGVVGGATVAAYMIMSNLRVAERDHFELFHMYYQPLLVMLAMLWMWAIDVREMEQRRIAYQACFSTHDQQYLLSAQQLFQVRLLPAQSGLLPPVILCVDPYYAC